MQCQRPNFETYNCTELTDKNIGFCNSVLFGSVEGALPVTEETVVYNKDISKVGAIVKLGVLGFSTHSVIFIGTMTGKIGKIFVDDRGSKQLGTFEIVQHSFPVLDIKVNNNEDVYVMTENCVVNIADKDPCPTKETCQECMQSKNAACGGTYQLPGFAYNGTCWTEKSSSNIPGLYLSTPDARLVYTSTQDKVALYESKLLEGHTCIKKSIEDCQPNVDNGTEWLPSVGGQCLQIETRDILIHDDSSNSYREEKAVKFKFDPDIIFDNVFCQYENGGDRLIQAVQVDEYYECSLSLGDVPFTLNVVHSGNVIVSTKINMYKLSSVDSCQDCVRTSGFWCVKSVSCVINSKDCAGDFIVIGPDIKNECPMIKSTKLYMSHGQTENLRLEVANFHQFENRTEYVKCSLNGDKYDAYIETGNSRVICQNVKAPNGHAKMYLQYNNSNIDNSTDIEVYRCDNFASCEECKYQTHQNYQCDWCGSCVTTLHGGCINPESCPISIYRIVPSFGPENGGTLVNVSGKNIGYPTDNITVIINGAKCINVNVIEASTVLSCYSGSANIVGLSNGVTVSVNGFSSSPVENLYRYESQLELHSFKPDRSIISGGQKIQITGVNIGYDGSHYVIVFCDSSEWFCIPCRLFKIVSRTSFVCSMGKSGTIKTLEQLLVVIDDNTQLRLNRSFLIVTDPIVSPLLAEDATVFKSGGVKLTIQGRGFFKIGTVKVENEDDERCFIKSDTKVICKAPKYIESDFERRKRSPGQHFFVAFDNYVTSLTVLYVDDPVFEKLPEQIFRKKLNIVIKGQRILEGAKQEEYNIHIGSDGKCIITAITNFNISCLPPYGKPQTKTEDSIFILVEVGRIRLNVGKIHYPSSDSASNEAVLYGVIGCLPERSANMSSRRREDEIAHVELSEVENNDVIVDEAPESDTINYNYEDLGQLSSNNPYSQLHQGNAEYQVQDITELDNRTRNLSPMDYINLQV